MENYTLDDALDIAQQLQDDATDANDITKMLEPDKDQWIINLENHLNNAIVYGDY